MKQFFNFGLIILFATVMSCGATSNEQNLDRANFALDKCSISDTGSCNSAIEHADNILANEPNNPQAGMIKSSAQATNAGLELLSMMSDIANTDSNNDAEKFLFIHDNIIGSIQDIADLRSSILTLSGMTAPTATQDWHKDFYFQMGFLQSLEIFARPTIQAQPTGTSPVDPSVITAADRDIIEDDFIDADDNLIEGGIASSSSNGWDLVKAVRQNYCVLANASVAASFTLGELQDLIKCQLCIDETDPTICRVPAADMTKAAGDLVDVTNCAVFDFTVCTNAGPTTL